MNEYKAIYSKLQTNQIASEFSRLKENCYLEHAGATLYSDIQMANIFKELNDNLFGNPHAFNTSSKFTEDMIDQVRYLILKHFNTNANEYSVIFTSGATHALKIVAESFDYSNEGTFMYLEDNHTSVLGMRQYAKQVQTLSHNNAFHTFNQYYNEYNNEDTNGNSLFVYSAQCNFSGVKFPLHWIEQIQNGTLNQLVEKRTKWFCMLDAASFVSSNQLDLDMHKPDFVCVSFYKMFGYPTGVGALLVKNSSEYVLKKTYFGGGTVQMVLHTEHVFRSTLHERFEDGTLPFLSIISIRHGFETLKRLSLDMDLISKHTYALAKYVHNSLLLMHHSNGNPVAVLYHDTDYENVHYQGGIVNFNLLRANGQFIGYSEVLHMANLYRIHLRTGCVCNPGACQRHLKITSSKVKQHFLAGHVCGDQRDLVNGSPTGSVRISFGYMSRKQDADTFLKMIEECFATKPIVQKIPSYWTDFCKSIENKFPNLSETNHNLIINNRMLNNIISKNTDTSINHFTTNIFQTNSNSDNDIFTLEHIFVYPVKSCGPYSVLNNWNIEESTGLRYDRQWMIVNSAGVCLTQKQEQKMCLITPVIQIDKGLLQLHFPNLPSVTVPLEVNTEEWIDVTLCQSKICGDRVRCFDCGQEVSEWLCNALNKSDLRLLRQDSEHSRINRKGQQSQMSLANEAQFLLLNTASVKYLSNLVPSQIDVSNLISRFRANFIVNSKMAFIENGCNKIKIGNHTFSKTGPCTRCQMICIDQTTGEKTIEPLRTLSALTEGKIRFGVYLALEPSKTTSISISINDLITFQ